LQTDDTPLTTWGLLISEPPDSPTGTTAAAHMAPVHPTRSIQVFFQAETTCDMDASAPATTTDAPARYDSRRARAVRPRAAQHPLVLFGDGDAHHVRLRFRQTARHNRYRAIADLWYAA